jgi:beta-lactamase superfamily II metal-dependent hydrolase
LTLTFYVLNVGQGSSVVIEYAASGAKVYGVVDSNCPANQTPRALTKLQSLGAKKLSFVCLTHPHDDHVSGLYTLVRAFPNAVDAFYCCPLGGLLNNRARLKKLAQKIKVLLGKSDDRNQRYAALEFGQILRWAEEGAGHQTLAWHECSGEDVVLAPQGFIGVDVRTILPPSRVTGSYIQRIAQEDMSVTGRFEDNEISLALKFSAFGRTVVLGGDGTRENWEARQKFEARQGTSLSASAVNLPHHGSKYDCVSGVLDQLFARDGKRFAISSGDGYSHPDVEVIQLLKERKIDPYCTNLIPACGANVRQLLTLPQLEPALARWVREVASNTRPQVCQGDITIRIFEDGRLEVEPEHRHACGFRGDFDHLFAA